VILLFCLLSSLNYSFRVSTAGLSESYVVFEGDQKWKYWPLVKKIDNLMRSGVIKAIGSPDQGVELSVAKIDSMRLTREIVSVPDYRYAGEMRDTVVSNYTPIEDWYDGLVYTMAWTEEDNATLRGQVMSIGLTYTLRIDGFDYGSIPAFFTSMDLLEVLTPSEQSQLSTLMAENCTEFKSATRLYSKESPGSQHPDSMLDLSVFKTKDFFNDHEVFYDPVLKKPITKLEEFTSLVHHTDTIGLNWNSRYLWSYPKWVFTDHLLYSTEAHFEVSSWQVLLSWKGIGLSGLDRNKREECFFMHKETFKNQVPPNIWKQTENDYKDAALRGFEHPTIE